ncbi:serine/threonine-protein kinase [Actinokineospora globicatena]|uniref:serine/threonine-protein kinase n=1 Tax=Actinokineospora globicatena TaxID=103729 RepID=UPI0020A32520|nr:serine/threonine-protein kinase [Actinokineospora globicatena]MCP2306327.1 Serine/threonine protein kinase [Actinokineospora globicatena]GLW81753.1 hypothetical protein Aglo01_62340 [Actinokineospora globicatena]GLW88548.1 hypothetical protein Aglo02_61870 [Actinokineospora globicatena]
MRELLVHDPRRVGDYALLGRLGRGAMGTVYLARSPGGRLVAVKVARGELAQDPEFRLRFRQEIEMARAVGGFWTAAVVGADPDADRPWLATEYVPGPTLTEAVRAGGPLPEPALRALLAGLAEALAAIHTAGLVHRDLKPSNVLLAEDGPRVIDFGIAKAVRSVGVTATGVLFGTPGYLSPEQISGGVVGPPSDVFALGAVLVYAATGTGPFGNGEVASLLYRAVHTGPDLDGVPGELRPVVSRCLNSRAEARPTPADLLAEVGHGSTGQWLPPTVQTLVERHQTEFLKPVTPRTPTLVQRVEEAAGERLPRPRKPEPVVPKPVPAVPAVAAPVVPAAARARPVPAAVDHLRVRTSRGMPLLWSLVAGVGVVAALGVTARASKAGYDGVAAIGLVLSAVLALSAARSLWRAVVVRPSSVVITSTGLAISSKHGNHHLTWLEISRVRVVGDKGKPWLVVWPHPDRPLGKRHSRRHGGYRVHPVAHHHGKTRRSRDILELRSTLERHAGRAYDPTP